MEYTEDFIKRVLAATDISNVIGEYTQLHQKKNIVTANCPFHSDKNESLIIYPEKNTFHCFDCGKGGNAAVFLMELKGIQMHTAIETLANKAGLPILETDIEKPTNEVLKSNLYNIYKDAAIFYTKKLRSEEGAKALAYLKGRGLEEKTIKSFGLGYAPEKGNALYKYLLAKGYDKELMLTAGLIKISETGPYDMFRGRVMYPIMNQDRRVIAFGGRVMDDKKPKYLNSPESPIFNKSETFYGIHDIKKAKCDYIILCEGNMDVISLHQAGFRNSLATLGTACTPNHIQELQKRTKNLILSYDGDQAGQKAAIRAIRALQDSTISAKVLSMAPCKDPDEFLKTFGKEEYSERIERSIDQLDFQLKYLAGQYDMKDPKQYQDYLSKAVDMILQSQETREMKMGQERSR